MARAHSKPLSFFTHPDDPEQWRWSDRMLAVALAEHEAGLHDCGHPRSLVFSPHSDGHFRIGEVLCNACAEVDKLHRKPKGEGSEELPGRRALVIADIDRDAHIRPWNGQFLSS